jgi:hypothetical protein
MYCCEISESDMCVDCKTITEIIKGHKIDMNGLKTKEKEKVIESYENIKRCIKEIPLLYEKSTRINKKLPSSYGMKHEIEKIRKTDTYISNGEFITAMIYSDFLYKTVGGMNCRFMYKRV